MLDFISPAFFELDNKEPFFNGYRSLTSTLNFVMSKYQILGINNKDMSGKPKFMHPLWVARAMPIPKIEEGDDLRTRIMKSKEIKDMVTVALLHDLVEDRKVTISELTSSNRTYPKHIRDAVEILSRNPSYKNLPPEEKQASYEEFVRGVIASGNKLAITVKYMDMVHNLSNKRFLNLSPEQRQDRIKKYSQMYKELKEAFQQFYPDEKALPVLCKVLSRQAEQNLGMLSRAA